MSCSWRRGSSCACLDEGPRQMVVSRDPRLSLDPHHSIWSRDGEDGWQAEDHPANQLDHDAAALADSRAGLALPPSPVLDREASGPSGKSRPGGGGARLVLLGRQGAGKGTQAVRLARRYVVRYLAVGDLLRAAVRSRSSLGADAKAYLDTGELVPDGIVIDMVREQVSAHGRSANGFVLDGFPRTLAQAEALVRMLEPDGVDLVIDLHVGADQVLSRLASRRVCADCGTNYSTLHNPPLVAGMCDVCGGEVAQRDDDTQGVIRRRLELYERETAPLVALFAERGALVTVDGTGSPDQVTSRLIAVVDGHVRRLARRRSADQANPRRA